MTILRAGLYERVSTDEQALRGFSIETQIENLEEYCKQNNIKVVDHYTDEGISGTKPPLKRPALQRLIDDVEAGKIDIILFTKLDRWFRSVKEYFKVQEILDKHKVEWKAIHENYDTTTANGQMAITIFLAVAQNERDRTAERIKVVFEHKRKNKEACFGGKAVPFGYTKKPDENGVMRLVKDPKTQEAVQAFWDVLIASNNLNKAIRHVFNAYGIKRHWKSWQRTMQTDFYCGMHRGVEDYCEPYVSVEDWLKINESRPIRKTPKGRIYLFRGLIRCPQCGNVMSGTADIRPSIEYKSYRCSWRGRGCDNGGTLSERRIEKQLLLRLEEFINGEIARVELEQAKPKPKPKNDVKALKENLRRLTVAYMAGNKSDEEYLREDAELKALIAKAETETPPAPPDLTPLKAVLETDFRTIYEGLTEEERQLFWHRLVKEIKIENKVIKEVIFF